MTRLHVLRPHIPAGPLSLDGLRLIVRDGADRRDIWNALRDADWTHDDVAALFAARRSQAVVESKCQNCGADTSSRGPGRPRIWCHSEECLRVRRKMANLRYEEKRGAS